LSVLPLRSSVVLAYFFGSLNTSRPKMMAASDHLLIPKLMHALLKAGLGHIAVVVGGIVPTNEEADLLRSGVAAVLHPGVGRDQIIAVVGRLADEAHLARDGAQGGQE